jgi:hypothetical protein
MKAIHIKTTGQVLDLEISGELKEMQDAVGGYIESVLDEGPMTLYCNDQGRIEPILPMNIVGMIIVAHIFQVPLNKIQSLHGDMIMVGAEREDTENWGAVIDLPDQAAEMAKQFDMYQPPEMKLTTLDKEGNEINYETT